MLMRSCINALNKHGLGHKIEQFISETNFPYLRTNYKNCKKLVYCDIEGSAVQSFVLILFVVAE